MGRIQFLMNLLSLVFFLSVALTDARGEEGKASIDPEASLWILYVRNPTATSLLQIDHKFKIEKFIYVDKNGLRSFTKVSENDGIIVQVNLKPTSIRWWKSNWGSALSVAREGAYVTKFQDIATGFFGLGNPDSCAASFFVPSALRDKIPQEYSGEFETLVHDVYQKHAIGDKK